MKTVRTCFGPALIWLAKFAEKVQSLPKRQTVVRMPEWNASGTAGRTVSSKATRGALIVEPLVRVLQQSLADVNRALLCAVIVLCNWTTCFPLMATQNSAR